MNSGLRAAGAAKPSSYLRRRENDEDKEGQPTWLCRVKSAPTEGPGLVAEAALWVEHTVLAFKKDKGEEEDEEEEEVGRGWYGKR